MIENTRIVYVKFKDLPQPLTANDRLNIISSINGKVAEDHGLTNATIAIVPVNSVELLKTNVHVEFVQQHNVKVQTLSIDQSPLNAILFENTKSALKSSRDTFHKIPGVLGTGITHSDVTGIGSGHHLVVYLEKYDISIINLIPDMVNGIPVAYEVTGKIMARACSCTSVGGQCNCTGCAGVFSNKYRPLQGGASIANPDGLPGTCMAGTLGDFPWLSDHSQRVILSNNHVMALDDPAERIGKIGDPIIQPGTLDNGNSNNDVVGTLYRELTILTKGSGTNTVDGAIATISSGITINLTNLCNYAVGPTIAPALNQSIKKAGRTTGCTTGTITALDVTVDVDYGSSNIGTFTGQIQTSANFDLAGDSGSVVVDGNTNNAVGLLFAGGSSGAFLNVMSVVESALGITFSPATGTISSWTSPPGAEIYLNGVDQGAVSGSSSAPNIITVSAGSYIVGFRLDGYYECTVNPVVVNAGSQTTASCVLATCHVFTCSLVVTNTRTSATCPSLDSIVGDNIELKVNISQGTSPYTINFRRNGVIFGTIPPSTAQFNGTYAMNYTTSSSDVGTITLGVEVIDSCGNGLRFTDQCSVNVTVPPPVWTSTTISGCGSAINIGATCQLTAVCLDQYSATIACGALTWVSSNTAIATVNSSGLVTAVASGSAGITARNSTGTIVSNSISVTVNAPVCPTISCSITACPPSSIVQGTATSTTVLWSGGTPNYSLQLLRDGVAYGSAVTGIVGAGSLTFNFTVDSSWSIGSHTVSVRITDACSTPQTCTTATCAVTVTAPPIWTSTSISAISGCGSAMNIGATCQLTAVCLDQYTATIACGALTWVSSNTAIATVNSSGLVTAVAAGSAGITARNSAGTIISNSISISVNAAVCPIITSCSVTSCPPTSIVQGTSASITASWVGGTALYKAELLRDGVVITTIPNNSASPVQFNFTAGAGWTVGSHTVAVRITDGCSTPQVCTTVTCPVTVTVACTVLGASMNIV